jgi:hypothetical protein
MEEIQKERKELYLLGIFQNKDDAISSFKV